MALFDPWDAPKPTSPLIEDLEALHTYYKRKNSWISGYIFQKANERKMESRCLIGAIDALHVGHVDNTVVEWVNYVGAENIREFDIETGDVISALQECTRSKDVVIALAQFMLRYEHKRMPRNTYGLEFGHFVETLREEMDDEQLTIDELLERDYSDFDICADLVYNWNDVQKKKGNITTMIRKCIAHEQAKLGALLTA